jgi:hypothetical protein
MKSINQAAKEYAEMRSSSPVFIENHITDFKEGVEFAQRWISVDDELPSDRETVLIKYLKDGKEKKSCGQIVLYSIEVYWQSGAWTQIPVTHWRHIDVF